MNDLLDKQKQVRDLCYIRPDKLEELENRAIELCDLVIENVVNVAKPDACSQLADEHGHKTKS